MKIIMTTIATCQRVSKHSWSRVFLCLQLNGGTKGPFLIPTGLSLSWRNQSGELSTVPWEEVKRLLSSTVFWTWTHFLVYLKSICPEFNPTPTPFTQGTAKCTFSVSTDNYTLGVLHFRECTEVHSHASFFLWLTSPTYPRISYTICPRLENKINMLFIFYHKINRY